MAVKPTPQQAAKLKRGKLLNQRFRFKKDEDDTSVLRGFNRFYKKEEAAAINNEGLCILDELKKIGAMSGSVDGQRQIPAWEALIMNKHNIQPLGADVINGIKHGNEHVDYETLCDKLDSSVEGEDEPDMDDTIEPPVKISLEGFPLLKELAENGCIEPRVNVLRARYDELVTELAMIVSDRIKSFKKRSIVMAKITGEEYGFLEHSNWATNETTTFKHWHASWKFERSIGTNTIFEARFNHATFELVSYRTIFMYDPRPKHVISRDPNAKVYSVDNDEDLVDIIAIYEKAIDFVYDYGKK